MRTLALIALACGAAANSRAVGAQVTGNVEAGISDVRYDGFLASGAASIAPTLRWEHPKGRGFLTARGTYLRFESGRRSLDASANASWFTPLGRQWRGELGATAGASDYANIASFSHGQADARLHWMNGDHGGSLDRSLVGDTAYTDLRSAGRWRSTGIVLEGTVGARFWSRGGGRGVFGDGSATVTIAPHAALVVSAGRYPTDAVSGSIAGRYVTAALRLGAIGVRTRSAPGLPGNVHASGADGSASLSETRLEVQAQQDEDVQLTLFAPGATTVEITGDFTDWQPVPLSRNPESGDTWRGTFRISRGVHRINVRRDGGRWVAPGGTTHSVDDYDGEVGIFVLP